MFDIFYISNPPTDFPQAVKVKNRAEAREKSRTRFCWLLDGYNSYYAFDLLWEPVPWEADQVHVWASQHQDHGGTELIPKSFGGHVNYHKDIVTRIEFPTIVHLNHGNGVAEWLSPTSGAYTLTKSRYINDYLGTLKRVVQNHSSEEYLWVISSVCDYTQHDFNWHPSEFQQEMMHVFPTNEQKFGDTFYINVQDFLNQVSELELLEWYNTICFQDISVPSKPLPVILHDCDSQADAVKEHVFKSVADGLFTAPYALFTKHPVSHTFVPTPNLWRPKTRTVIPLSKSGDPCLVPKDAIPYIINEMYDYPYIDKNFQNQYSDDPLDIIFLSNGEKCAEDNYDHLVDSTGAHPLRVKNINGRLAAYQECARQARTDWFFIVYAKLKVDRSFNWDWQPDRLQKPKHYIFNAYNPITEDTYGHMAMIAFNKKLVLEHDGQGLDFSLHQEHEVVPVLSGEAVYADNEWDAWRTAFREVLKLLDARQDTEAGERCQRWLNAEDEWTKIGAYDAQRFYNEEHGDPEKLRLSYEWDWLAKYFYMKYIEWSKPQ